MKLQCIGVYDEGTDLWMMIPTLILNDLNPPPQITLPSGFVVEFIKTSSNKHHLYRIVSGPDGGYLSVSKDVLLL